MIHPLETFGTLAAAVLVCAAVVITPQPKPEPPAEPQKSPIEMAMEECAKNPEQVCVAVPPVVRVEPQTTEQKQIQDVRVQIKTVSDKADRIEKLLDERTKDERVDR
jgi:hypothetical protein